MKKEVYTKSSVANVVNEKTEGAPSLSLRCLEGQGGDSDLDRSAQLSRGGSCALNQSQNPHPFDFAQGRLCRKKRDKGGAPSSL